MTSKLVTLATVIDKRMRRWSITVQVDNITGRRVAYFGVWPAGRVNPRSSSIGLACCTVGEPGKAKLDDFNVDRLYQNYGIGSKLLEEIEKWALYMNVTHLYGDLSDVDADHFPMLHHLYTRHGWTWCLFNESDPRFRPNSPLVGIVEKTFSIRSH